MRVQRIQRMVATMLLAYPGIAAPAIIAVQFNGGVVSINEATGVGLAVGPSGTSGLNSLAADTSGTLFSATNVLGAGGQLFTINPASGVGTPGAVLGFGAAVAADVRGLAFSAANVLFAINNTGPAGGLNPDDLFTINVAAGAGALIGATGLTGASGTRLRARWDAVRLGHHRRLGHDRSGDRRGDRREPCRGRACRHPVDRLWSRWHPLWRAERAVHDQHCNRGHSTRRLGWLRRRPRHRVCFHRSTGARDAYTARDRARGARASQAAQELSPRRVHAAGRAAAGVISSAVVQA